MEFWFIRSLVQDLGKQQEYERAKTYADQGRQIASKQNDSRGRVLLEVDWIRIIALKGVDRFPEIQSTLHWVLPILRKHCDAFPDDSEAKVSLGLALSTSGFLNHVSGHQAEADLQLREALLCLQAPEEAENRVLILCDLGEVYASMNRFNEAQLFFERAGIVAEGVDNPSTKALVHEGLSAVYTGQKKLKEGLFELEKAKKLGVQAGDDALLARCDLNSSDLYIRMKDYQAAVDLLRTARRTPAILGNPSLMAACKVNLGIALNRIGQHIEGLKLLSEGVEFCRGKAKKQAAVEVLGNLAEEYAFAGKYREAYEAWQEFRILNDDLKLEENSRRISESNAAQQAELLNSKIVNLQIEKLAKTRVQILLALLCMTGFSLAILLLWSRRQIMKANNNLENLNGRNQALIVDLKSALSEVRTLQGLIPICAKCKKIRDDKGFWNQLEVYIQSHSDATFSHGYCPGCAQEFRAELHQFFRSQDQRGPKSP